MSIIENAPDLWRGRLPWPPVMDGNKYKRGHAIMAGGHTLTGAIRMAALAATRIGAGLCTIAAPKNLLGVYTAELPHILFRPAASLVGFGALLKDQRLNAVLIGPGQGQDDVDGLRKSVLAILAKTRGTVLDADALTVFAKGRARLLTALHDRCVLTPHEGEFGKLFPELTGGKVEKAVAAAELCGCVVLIKGSETVIAAPGRDPVVNRHSTPWLATAGTGDTLAGMITGLLAQGMDAFDAACAAVWMHGEAGLRCGPGLVAPDLAGKIPDIMREFA